LNGWIVEVRRGLCLDVSVNLCLYVVYQTEEGRHDTTQQAGENRNTSRLFDELGKEESKFQERKKEGWMNRCGLMMMTTPTRQDPEAEVE
jgi:hypothetical protein